MQVYRMINSTDDKGLWDPKEGAFNPPLGVGMGVSWSKKVFLEESFKLSPKW